MEKQVEEEELKEKIEGERKERKRCEILEGKKRIAVKSTRYIMTNRKSDKEIECVINGG